MAQERLSVRKIREILRLKLEVGLSNRAIARACKLSNSTVGEYLRRAQAAGIGWPLPDELDEEALYRQLFPEAQQSAAPERPLPDWEAVHRELSHKGVTLRLLWIEYQEKHPAPLATATPSIVNTTAAGAMHTPWPHACRTKATKCWKWTMPG